MKFRLGQEHSHEQEQKLSVQQKRMLALLLRFELATNLPFETKKGIEGLKHADAILKQHNQVGVLIGSVAKKAWQRSFDEESFNKKDIDVLVFPNQEGGNAVSYGDGIDWWLPGVEPTITVARGQQNQEPLRYFKNVNGIVLHYTMDTATVHNPGLYLMNRDDLITLQYVEASSCLDYDDDVMIKKHYVENQERAYQKVPARHLPDELKNQIMTQLTISGLNHQAYHSLLIKLEEKS